MRMARRNPSEPTPICRCRVLYLGSSVPQVTKDGLQGIQEPLKELYPAEGAISARGIDSWLSVWSNGLLLENVDENQKKVTRFFPINTLHYCAAVRYVVVSSGGGASVPRFLPLDSPFARNPNINHPPLFACIMRRTTGIKVLECHAFICKRETPANALVRCCFHAYADSMYAKRLEGGSGSHYGPVYDSRPTEERAVELDCSVDCSSSTSEVVSAPADPQPSPAGGGSSPDTASGDENHKVWSGPAKVETEVLYSDYESGTMRSQRSSLYGTAGPSRSQRPRQMVMPSVAPPPPQDTDKENKKDKKDKHKKKDEIKMNGSLRSPFLNGTHSANGSARPSSILWGGSASPHKWKGRLCSSLSERKNRGHRPPQPFMIYQGPPQGGPHMVPLQGYPPPAPHMMGPPMGAPMMIPPPMGAYSPQSYAGKRSPTRPLEEPIYMPSARPLSPTASFQPGHFPHEQYLWQNYAVTPAADRPKQKKKKRQKKDEEDIYGRKGHINERAFSYSIREEHRSRSYGSLAGLGDESLSKKEREIMQMTANLDLSGDEIERVVPRPGVYKPHTSDRLSIVGSVASRLSRSSRR